MLIKLSLPTVIGVLYLLTATIAVTSTTTTTTTTSSTATQKSIYKLVGTFTGENVTNSTEITRKGNSRIPKNVKGNTKDLPLSMFDDDSIKKYATKNKAAELTKLRGSETTTSLLPLQPPLNVTSTTTTTTYHTPPSFTTQRRRMKKHQFTNSAAASQPPFQTIQSDVPNNNSGKRIIFAQSSSAAVVHSSSPNPALVMANVNVKNDNVVKSDNDTTQYDGDMRKKVHTKVVESSEVPSVEITTKGGPSSSSSSKVSPEKANSYINFDITDNVNSSPRATARPTRDNRMETVNEVLSNLFPNGFTDIFRFSYASELPDSTMDEAQPQSTREDLVKQRTTTTPTLIIETKTTISSRGKKPITTTTTTKTTPKPRKARGRTLFGMEKNRTKEHRGELGTGRTEIMVEKIEISPRSLNSASGELRDGSNVITKDDLLRINRAAVDSPVLPSLLVDPIQENTTTNIDRKSKTAMKQAPIIILNDNYSGDMEGISAEDNLIAESQNVGEQFDQRLPIGDKTHAYNVGPESDVSIRIMHEKPSSFEPRPIYVPDEQQQLEREMQETADQAEATMRYSVLQLPTQQLDSFQEHAEKNYHQKNSVQEATSRKFLQSFNPALSEGAGTSTPLGRFHYEANGLQPSFYMRTIVEPPKQKEKKSDGASKKPEMERPSLEKENAEKQEEDVESARTKLEKYQREAAQLRYFKEQQYLQQQQQLLQQRQQLLLQRQQQEQQRQQHERLMQQQQEQHMREHNQQLQQQMEQSDMKMQQQKNQHEQLQQQQEQQMKQQQMQHEQQQHQLQREHQQQQLHQQMEQQIKQQQHSENEQQMQKQKQQQATPQIEKQEFYHLYSNIQGKQEQQPPVQQQYVLYQQHPPPHEYKQIQKVQQQNQYQPQYQRKQKQEKEKEEENAIINKQKQMQKEQVQREKQQENEQKQFLMQQQSMQSQQQQSKAPARKDSEPASASLNQQTYQNHMISYPPHQQRTSATPQPHSVVFVTLHRPPSQNGLNSEIVHKSPYEYVTQAAESMIPKAPAVPMAPSSLVATAAPASPASPAVPPTPAAILKHPKGPYTFVEVQKSVNTHNKLITEKDGKFVEEHETIYPTPQYTPQYQQQMPKVEESTRPPQTMSMAPTQEYQSPMQQQQSPPPQPQQQQEPQSQLQQINKYQPPPLQQSASQPQKQSEAPKPSSTLNQPTSHTELSYAHYPHHYAEQLSGIEEGVHPNEFYFVPKHYMSLSTNPINVQHIDEPEQQEEASSYAHYEHVLPLQETVVHEQPEQPAQYVKYIYHYTQQPTEEQGAQPHEHPHTTVNHQMTPQAQKTHAHSSEQQVAAETHQEQQKVAAAVAEKENDSERRGEKGPMRIPYPVHVPQYIDRPYPVQEIVETHVPVPYPVPEPVPVPVHVDRYIDRPYPVEKIVEKRVPYPVEKVVEKIVEKEIPVEVEKIVEKVVNRPVPIPIRVPVAVPVRYAQQSSSLPHDYDEQYEVFAPPLHTHANELAGGLPPSSFGLSDFGGRSPLSQQIPPKVLQNYYARMLKKLLPQALPQRGLSSPTTTTTSSAAGTPYTHTQARLKSPTPSPLKSIKSTKKQKPVGTSSSSTSAKQYSFKIGDMRYDLKPPPPPPTGPEWSKGSRYIYNTLPHDLSVADTLESEQLSESVYPGPFAPSDEPYDEFQRWRNGHSLKRSPQFGRNLQMEYGFKPPLVPSVEINEQGIPLNAEEKKDE